MIQEKNQKNISEDSIYKNEPNKKFKEQQLVILIFNQEILFDGEPSTITFFRDITTSMLYEQVLNEQRREQVIQQIVQNDFFTNLQSFKKLCGQILKHRIHDSNSLESSMQMLKNQAKLAKIDSKNFQSRICSFIDL